MATLQDQLIHCDKEPIHIPGKIQQHGYLVAIDKHDFTIQYFSENLLNLTGISAEKMNVSDISILFSGPTIQLRQQHLSQLKDFSTDTEEQKLAPLHVKINDSLYYLLAHKSGESIVLEFEPVAGEGEVEIQQLIGSSVTQILEGSSVQRSLQNAARMIKQMIGYERIMVYKFWEDGHGEVIAEDKDEGQEPFFGLHYPASDIPKQARELYKINLIRIIADVPSEPVKIIAVTQQLADVPLDLTHSTLRAVSPVHIEYLKNMKVLASFSISLIVNGQLWGLIACHHSVPKFIDQKAREGAKLIGQILSSSVEYKSNEQGKDSSRIFNAANAEILRLLQLHDNIGHALTRGNYTILNVTNAKGAAFIYDKNVQVVGRAPSVDEIKSIVSWLSKNVSQQIYSTTSLAKEFAEAKNFNDVASGLLACELSREMSEYILWFKPEILQSVSWAGNPDKQKTIDESGNIKISPRTSFASWTEEIKETSEPWSRNEISGVMKLREDILQVVNQKANQIRILNEKLQEAYDELDTFSFTISHDLKTPLASIKNYTEILLEENSNLSQDELSTLKRIIRGSDKMNTLINEVLAYSRIGRKEVIREKINVKNLLDDIVIELRSVYKGSNPTITIGDAPDIFGDKTMISQVFSNLISNAVKYASKKDAPVIKINGEKFPHEVIYSIEDNGIGIDMSFGNQIFEIFKRLNNAVGFEGSGVGLSIVKRIIEKHQGKIWYESEVGSGTKFYISFNNH